MSYDVLELLTYDDLSSDLKVIHDTLGMQAVKLLMRNLGGSELYICKPGSLYGLVEKVFKRNSGNLRRTAAEISLSKNHIARLARRFGWKRD